MAETLAWTRYFSYLSVLAASSPEAVLLKDSVSNPQLAEFASKTLCAVLRSKGQIPENCRVLRCVSASKRGGRRTETPSAKGSSHSKREVIGVSGSWKDLHRDYLESCNIRAPNTARKFLPKQLLSRSHIAFLRPDFRFEEYNGLVYFCPSDTDPAVSERRRPERMFISQFGKEQPLHPAKVDCESGVARLTLSSGRGTQIGNNVGVEFDLSECTVSGLLCHPTVPSSLKEHIDHRKNIQQLYVLDVSSFYEHFDYPSEEKIAAYQQPFVRPLTPAEISELLFCYTGVRLPDSPSAVESVAAVLEGNVGSGYSSTNRIYAWIRDTVSSGATKNYFMQLAVGPGVPPSEQPNKTKSTYCRWPCCLSLSASHLELAPIKVAISSAAAGTVAIGLGRVSFPAEGLERVLALLPAYKTKRKEPERKANFEHFCPVHRGIAAALAGSPYKLCLYAVYPSVFDSPVGTNTRNSQSHCGARKENPIATSSSGSSKVDSTPANDSP